MIRNQGPDDNGAPCLRKKVAGSVLTVRMEQDWRKRCGIPISKGLRN